MNLSKNDCRKIYLEKRRALSPMELRQYSEQIATNLLESFNLENKTVSLFLPIELKKEIDTYIILEKAIALGATVCIPKANFEEIELVHYRYEGPKQLELTKFGIPEPKYGVVISPKKIDLVIVPLLIFDKRGYRVGYGKGFYDRLIKLCTPTTAIVGVSIFDPIDAISDLSPYDSQLQYCITPETKYTF